MNISSRMRITGSSGMDVESMVQNLMQAEQYKLDNANKALTKLTWKQEAYRNTANVIRAFRDDYLSYTNPTTNFRQANMYNKMTFSVTSKGQEVKGVTATAVGSTKVSDHTINVKQLAQKDVHVSEKSLGTDIYSDKDIEIDKVVAGTKINVTLDDVTKTIELKGDYIRENISGDDAENAFLDDLNEQLKLAFGIESSSTDTNKPNKIVADISDGKLHITTTTGGHSLKISDVEQADSGTETTVTKGKSLLGFTKDASTSSGDYIYQTLDQIFDFESNDTLETTINGAKITLNKDMTLEDMIKTVNDSDANVKMSYNSLTGKVKFESKETGEINTIDFGKDSILADTFKLTDDVNKGGRKAQDAILSIDGVLTSRASNVLQFDSEGIKITLSEGIEFNEDINISATKDVDGIVENVKNLIEQYNTIITALTGTTEEKRAKSSTYSYYEPLTDEEKSALSDKEVELWETKAKQGLLNRDDTISKIVSDLRNNMFKAVDLGDGKSISLYEIGISSTDWRDKGKLTINEEKLRAAIEERPDDVISLFTKSSSISTHDLSNRNQRLSEEGIAERLNDIIDDAIRTNVSPTTGLRGSLIEKAGRENHTSDTENYMYDQIKAQNEKINKLLSMLEDKEDRYYKMFSAMESAMNKSNSQMDYLAQISG